MRARGIGESFQDLLVRELTFSTPLLVSQHAAQLRPGAAPLVPLRAAGYPPRSIRPFRRPERRFDQTDGVAVRFPILEMYPPNEYWRISGKVGVQAHTAKPSTRI